MKLKVMGPNGFQKVGFVDIFFKFKVYVSEPGIYKLEVFHSNFYFDPVMVEIRSEAEVAANPHLKSYSAYLYTLNTGAKSMRLMYPLELEPSHKIKYFEIEEPFNPMVWLKSPMVLMIGVSMMMMYMMKAVPKEEMEAYQD